MTRVSAASYGSFCSDVGSVQDERAGSLLGREQRPLRRAEVFPSTRLLPRRCMRLTQGFYIFLDKKRNWMEGRQRDARLSAPTYRLLLNPK